MDTAFAPLRESGLVVFERVLPSEVLESLREICSRVLERSTRLRLRVPLEVLARAPFRGGLIAALPHVEQALIHVLGSRPRASEYWIRASPRGAARQAIHRDRRSFEAFAVDLALTDLTRENGATEIWPGSHRIFDTDEASFRSTASRAAEHGSIRLVMPAGSVAIRDLRLWHRAMPNQTSDDRVILSITVQGHAA